MCLSPCSVPLPCLIRKTCSSKLNPKVNILLAGNPHLPGRRGFLSGLRYPLIVAPNHIVFSPVIAIINLSANPVSTTLKIHAQFDHFSPHPPLPLWCRPPSFLVTTAEMPLTQCPRFTWVPYSVSSMQELDHLF